jgi:hypothetical protein
LLVQIPGEDLGVLVDRAVDDRGSFARGQRLMKLELVRQEVALRVEGPALHVGIEVGEVGVLLVGLVEGGEPVALDQPGHQRRLARTDGARDRDVALHAPRMP